MSSVLSAAAVPVGAMILVYLAGALGFEALRRLGAPDREQDEDRALIRPFVDVIVGAVIIAVVLYVVSWAGGLNRAVIRLIVGAQVLLALVSRGYARSVRAAGGAAWSLVVRSTWLERLAALAGALLFAAFVVFALGRAIVPTIQADSATAYLNAANLYLNYHRLIDVGNFVGSMGRVGFLLLVYGMGAASARLAHAFLVGLSVTGFLLSAIVVSRLAGLAAGSAALAILATSSYALESVVPEAKFDGLTFAASAAALALCLRLATGAAERWQVIAAGAIAGFVAALSYNNIVAAGLLFAVAVWFGLRAELPRARQVAFAAMLAAAAASAPTFLHNVVLFRNPVFPFAAGVFGSGLGTTIPTDGFAYQYVKSIEHDYVASSVQQVLTLPLRLFVRDSARVAYGQREPVDSMSTTRDAWLGGLLMAAMAAAPVLVLLAFPTVRRRLGVPVPIVAVCVGGFWMTYVFWATTQHLFRYLSAGLPFALAAAAIPVAVLGALCAGRARGIFGAFVAVAATVAIAAVAADWYAPAVVKFRPVRTWVAEAQTEEQYVATNFIYGPGLDFGKTMMALRPRLHDGDKILSFITGMFYFGTNVRTFSGNGSNTLHSPEGMAKPLSRYADWQEWEGHLQSQGFRYMVINPTYLYLSAAESPIVRGYLAHRQPEFAIGTTQVFRLQ